MVIALKSVTLMGCCEVELPGHAETVHGSLNFVVVSASRWTETRCHGSRTKSSLLWMLRLLQRTTTE